MPVQNDERPPAGFLLSRTTLDPTHKNFGNFLRRWRGRRAVSQLELALQSGVSARHISFLETGRSRPSRGMVLRLADALNVPLRERNVMLTCAGFAPRYRETDLDAPEMLPINRVITFLLKQHEPFPALLLDRSWNVLRANRSAIHIFNLFSTQKGPWLANPLNLMRLALECDGLRSFLVNWDEVAPELVAATYRAAMAYPSDDRLLQLMTDLQALPDLPESGPSEDSVPSPYLVLPLHLKRDDIEIRLFSTVTTLGTSQDITLQELHLESFMPADSATESMIRKLLESQ